MRATLVLDISPNSVGGGLVRVPDHLSHEIVYHVREEFDQGEEEMLAALRKVLKNLSTNGVSEMSRRNLPSSLDHVAVTLSLPWSRNHFAQREVRSDEPFHFNHEQAQVLIDEEVMRHRENLNGEEHEILERTVGGLRVNGYAMPFPATRMGNHAVVGIFVSSAKKSLLRRIEDEVTKWFSTVRGLSVQSFSALFHRIFFHSHGHGKTLFALVGPEVTEVVSIVDGHISNITTLDIGHGDVARGVSRDLNIPLHTAHSYMTLFAKGKLHYSLLNKVENALLKVEDKWHSLWSPGLKDEIGHGVFLHVIPSEAQIWETLFKSLDSKASVHHIPETLPLVARFSASLLSRK